MPKGDYEAFSKWAALKRSILVVAPHPDDETIGCGGLIALCVEKGLDVSVVLVTDGAASHQGSIEWPAPRLAALRQQELFEALNILGVTAKPIFLSLPDAQTSKILPSAKDAARTTLIRAIDLQRPDVVLTTWRREPHCDHKFSYDLTSEALAFTSARPVLLEYIVWTPITGGPQDQPCPHEVETFALDISQVQALKRSALAAHRSQLGQIIYDAPAAFAISAEQREAMSGSQEHFFRTLSTAFTLTFD